MGGAALVVTTLPPAPVPAAIDLPSDPQNLDFVYSCERDVRPYRPANPGCSRHTAVAAAAAGRTAPTTDHHCAPILHTSTASAGGVGRRTR